VGVVQGVFQGSGYVYPGLALRNMSYEVSHVLLAANWRPENLTPSFFVSAGERSVCQFLQFLLRIEWCVLPTWPCRHYKHADRLNGNL
jgi:hypothetical protein